MTRRFWPYDEVTASQDPKDEARFVLSAPWLSIHFSVDQHRPRIQNILKKVQEKNLKPEDLEDLNWFFSSWAQFPFSYILPRAESFGQDQHHVLLPSLPLKRPKELLMALCQNSQIDTALNAVANSIGDEWTWDLDATLEFSQTAEGFDPEALFSVGRRFHLLNDLDINQTEDLLKYLAQLPKNSEEFNRKAAVVIRQNHYITQNCERVLSAALPISQGAHGPIVEFIQAESGHDQIIGRAIQSLGSPAAKVPVLDCTVVLMELFQQISRRNILAFSMVVDIFERSSYQPTDPFAQALQKGGAELAAQQVDIHREINDSGDHENVALEFLESMSAVDRAYAEEALRMAELLTQVILLVSIDSLKMISGK